MFAREGANMKRYVILLAALAVLSAARARADEHWWYFQGSGVDPCTDKGRYSNPMDWYDTAKSNGFNPAIKDKGDEVYVYYKRRSTEIFTRWFRTLEACHKADEASTEVGHETDIDQKTKQHQWIILGRSSFPDGVLAKCMNGSENTLKSPAEMYENAKILEEDPIIDDKGDEVDV
jgi:hypothetical protein